MYIKCTSAGKAFKVKAMGVNKNGYRVDCSKGKEYQVRKGSVRKVSNYVWEWGHKKACLQAWRDYFEGFTAKGVWSPDSVPFTDKY